MKVININPKASQAPTRDFPKEKSLPDALPEAQETRLHPTNAGGENASLLFVGTATTIM